MSDIPVRTPRTVIITGASAGVGRALAHRFAEAGDRVGLIARDAEALEDVRREGLELGADRAAVAAADVSDPQQMFAAAEALEAELGPVDVWINDAMQTVLSPLSEMTPAEFRRVTDVTYLGFVYGTMAALKSMRPRGEGRIIQMGSALAYRGIPLQSAYCGAKHAIRGFTDSVRTELQHEGSKVSIALVDLPAVNTPQFDWARAHTPRQPRPMGKPIEPEVVAEAVFKVSQGGWREYWLGWPTAKTIIANSVLPGVLDRFLAKKAVDGQQTSDPVEPWRRDSLFTPLGPAHRTRGSFSKEAGHGAMLLPEPLARVGVVALGAAAFFALGAMFRRS